MKTPNRIERVICNVFREFAPKSIALLLALFAGANTAHAQQVIAAPPAVSTVPLVLRETQPATPLSSIASAFTPGLPLFKWGLVDVRPHLLYSLSYGNGIQFQRGQPANTAIQSMSPGVLLDIGVHWILDYTPTWTLYSNPAFKDTLDHRAMLSGGASYGEWTFRLSQSYALESPVLVQTAEQTRQKSYGTSLSASGPIGIRTTLELGANLGISAPENFTTVRDWSGSGWLHYQFSPRLDAAIGGTLGYTDVSVGVDMNYAQPEAKFVWKATDKVSLVAQGGAEIRQFRSGGRGDLVSPIYSATLQYQPGETTTLTLGASRGVSASYFADQVTRNVGWNAGLSQRLLEKLYLSAGFGQQTSTYISTQRGVSVSRDDKGYSFNVRLSTTFLSQGTVAVFYQRSHNDSNDLGYGFASHQTGLEVGYRW